MLSKRVLISQLMINKVVFSDVCTLGIMIMIKLIRSEF